jgi:hypothetical protein
MKESMFHASRAVIAKTGEKIPTLRTMDGPKRILGRKIIDASPFLGSYGMGGAGFFGLCLKDDGYRPEEWLVLTLWGSDSWLLLDGRVLNCYPLDSKKYKPWVTSTFFSEQRETISKLFTGFTVEEFELNDRNFWMVLGKRGTKDRVLELPLKLSKLPPYGNGEPRTWETDEKLLDGFLVSKSEYINI